MGEKNLAMGSCAMDERSDAQKHRIIRSIDFLVGVKTDQRQNFSFCSFAFG
jgi:hypothetical protein